MRFTDQKVAKTAAVGKKSPIINLVTAVSLTEECIAAIKPGHPFILERVDLFSRVVAGSVMLDVVIAPDDAILLDGALAIDAVPEKIQVGIARYRVGGVYVAKAAETAIVFSAAHKITALKFGTITVQIDDAGAVTTKVPLATQLYASAALALAAAAAPDAGKKRIGLIRIEAGVADWDANTDDLTDASDLVTAVFVTDPPVGRALVGAEAFLGGQLVAAALSATLANIRGGTLDSILFLLTTDGAGVLTNASIIPTYRPQPMAGDGSHE